MNRALRIFLGFLILFYRILEGFILMFVPKLWRAKKVIGRNDVVLITGAGSGIGRSLATRFARAGCVVVTWDINDVANQETGDLIERIGGKVKAYQCDVGDRRSVYAVAEKVKREVGDVTVLVNNAGVVVGKKLTDLSDDGIERLFKVNTLAHFWTCKCFLPEMMAKNKGHIVNIASLAGLFPLEKLTDYCATKHAIVGFSEALTLELRYGGYDGVNVTTICPGLISTGLFEGFNMGLVPPLRPDQVAEEVMTSVLLRERLVILPRYLNLLAVTHGILPNEAFTVLSEIFGSSEAMKNFRGRSSGSEEFQPLRNGNECVKKIRAYL